MPGSARWGDESGVTLIELVITIAILGIAFSAILAGLATSIKMSGIQETHATAEATLRTAAERVKSADYDCAGNYGAEVTSVQSLTPQPTDPVTFTAGPPCPDPDTGIQVIKLTVPKSDGTADLSLTIVKRKSDDA